MDEVYVPIEFVNVSIWNNRVSCKDEIVVSGIHYDELDRIDALMLTNKSKKGDNSTISLNFTQKEAILRTPLGDTAVAGLPINNFPGLLTANEKEISPEIPGVATATVKRGRKRKSKETPVEETPLAETIDQEAPAENVLSEENHVEETPVGDIPVEEPTASLNEEVEPDVPSDENSEGDVDFMENVNIEETPFAESNSAPVAELQIEQDDFLDEEFDDRDYPLNVPVEIEGKFKRAGYKLGDLQANEVVYVYNHKDASEDFKTACLERAKIDAAVRAEFIKNKIPV
jgi:hypothetical protein